MGNKLLGNLSSISSDLSAPLEFGLLAINFPGASIFISLQSPRGTVKNTTSPTRTASNTAPIAIRVQRGFEMWTPFSEFWLTVYLLCLWLFSRSADAGTPGTRSCLIMCQILTGNNIIYRVSLN